MKSKECPHMCSTKQQPCCWGQGPGMGQSVLSDVKRVSCLQFFMELAMSKVPCEFQKTGRVGHVFQCNLSVESF
jgi:hypothetical protein